MGSLEAKERLFVRAQVPGGDRLAVREEGGNRLDTVFVFKKINRWAMFARKADA